MVLLEVDSVRIAILAPLESDSPRTADVDRPTPGLVPLQGMEPKAWKIQLAQLGCRVQRVQSGQAARSQIRPHARASPCEKQIAQALVAEASDHRVKCNVNRYIGQASASFHHVSSGQAVPAEADAARAQRLRP
jgi:hypothetical protein